MVSQTARKTNTYIDVVDIKDFGLEEQPKSSGLLDGLGQLTVCLRTGTGNTHTTAMKPTTVAFTTAIFLCFFLY